MFAGGTSSRSLLTVFTSNGFAFTRGSSCFGLSGVLRGQNRDPTPPARITAHLIIRFFRFFRCNAGNLRNQRIKLFWTEWLGEKCRCAISSRLSLVLFFAGRRENDDRHVL